MFFGCEIFFGQIFRKWQKFKHKQLHILLTHDCYIEHVKKKIIKKLNKWSKKQEIIKEFDVSSLIGFNYFSFRTGYDGNFSWRYIVIQ